MARNRHISGFGRVAVNRLEDLIVLNMAHMRQIEIGGDNILVAMADGRCWFIDVAFPGAAALPVSRLAAERASLAASLMEGAVCAGLTRTTPAETGRPYTLLRYIRWLAGNTIFAGQTPDLFRRAASRFDAAGRPDLAAFARKKAAEEAGHADLAFRDLESLGLPAADVIRLIRPPSAEAFADRFRAYVESSAPVALFGFSYCLERMAVERDAAFIRNIDTLCGAGQAATRFLLVHSAVGGDHTHVHEQLAFFESLSDEDLLAVTRAAYETAAMLARQPEIDRALSDQEMSRRLKLADIRISPAEGPRNSPLAGTGTNRRAMTREAAVCS